ncbi:hypothetical protein OD350_06445 [Clostridium beijerinckii]|uniref:hypothetical protein n=1 Tax=Clostridium beijerinckii TaxID=1520 RepID=UPI002225DC3C|nr:hypothetical protein [Clostridium beijerinckii]UYZ37301.1 hypothetical protein OD350_06445 [Clostridium beijerinckii]
MNKHDTHNKYILDVLEDEEERLIKEILNFIPSEAEYIFNRLLEVIIEKVELSNKCIN